jgi:endonuclease-3
MKKADIFEFYRRLAELNPDPRTELEYGNDYQLLVAVVLSAQATDVGVNKATRALFRDVKTPAQMVALGEEGLKAAHQDHRPVQRQGEERDRPVRNSGARFRRRGSADRDILTQLPGVGRKTANVVMNCAFGAETFAVDTHIFRVGNRTGLAPGKTPLAVEKQLEEKDPGSPSRRTRITG